MPNRYRSGPIRSAVLERLGIALTTLRNWETSCPYLPRERGIKRWPKRQLGNNWKEPIRYCEQDIAAIESAINGDVRSAANDRLRSLRQKNMRVAQQRSVKRRYPKARDGQVNADGAAGIAQVDRTTIYRAHERGELKAVSEAPLRFDDSAVRKWSNDLATQPGDVAVVDLPARIPGPAGPKNRHGDSLKLTRIKHALRDLPVETYLRTRKDKRGRIRKFAHVHADRIDEIKAFVARVGTREQVRDPSGQFAQVEEPVTVAEQPHVGNGQAHAKQPKGKGGRPTGTGEWQFVRDWIDSSEEAQRIIQQGGKFVNYRLVDAWKEDHPDHAAVKRMNKDVMKELRKYKPGE